LKNNFLFTLNILGTGLLKTPDTRWAPVFSKDRPATETCQQLEFSDAAPDPCLERIPGIFSPQDCSQQFNPPQEAKENLDSIINSQNKNNMAEIKVLDRLSPNSITNINEAIEDDHEKPETSNQVTITITIPDPEGNVKHYEELADVIAAKVWKQVSQEISQIKSLHVPKSATRAEEVLNKAMKSSHNSCFVDRGVLYGHSQNCLEEEKIESVEAEKLSQLFLDEAVTADVISLIEKDHLNFNLPAADKEEYTPSYSADRDHKMGLTLPESGKESSEALYLHFLKQKREKENLEFSEHHQVALFEAVFNPFSAAGHIFLVDSEPTPLSNLELFSSSETELIPSSETVNMALSEAGTDPLSEAVGLTKSETGNSSLSEEGTKPLGLLEAELNSFSGEGPLQPPEVQPSSLSEARPEILFEEGPSPLIENVFIHLLGEESLSPIPEVQLISVAELKLSDPAVSGERTTTGEEKEQTEEVALVSIYKNSESEGVKSEEEVRTKESLVSFHEWPTMAKAERKSAETVEEPLILLNETSANEVAKKTDNKRIEEALISLQEKCSIEEAEKEIEEIVEESLVRLNENSMIEKVGELAASITEEAPVSLQKKATVMEAIKACDERIKETLITLHEKYPHDKPEKNVKELHEKLTSEEAEIEEERMDETLVSFNKTFIKEKAVKVYTKRIEEDLISQFEKSAVEAAETEAKERIVEAQVNIHDSHQNSMTKKEGIEEILLNFREKSMMEKAGKEDDKRIEDTLVSLHEKSMFEEAEIRRIREQCGNLKMIIKSQSSDGLLSSHEDHRITSLNLGEM
jgi:hypothetical protein